MKVGKLLFVFVIVLDCVLDLLFLVSGYRGGVLPSPTENTCQTCCEHCNSSSEYVCEICGDIFYSQETLDKHKQRNHNSATDGSNRSNVSDNQSNAVLLDKHKQRNHNSATDGSNRLNVSDNQSNAVLKCSICGKMCNGSAELKRHKNSEHHFTCDECGPDVWFLTKEELEEHKRIRHINRER